MTKERYDVTIVLISVMLLFFYCLRLKIRNWYLEDAKQRTNNATVKGKVTKKTNNRP
jgi:hypothetical protein